MGRSPSPRRRRASPDYRRRSRSRSPRRHSRRSPEYREYDRRDRPAGGPGGYRGNNRREDDVSDDDIKGESFADYRRLKRIKMMERNIRCIWRNTPSPPPEERARIQAELEQQAQDKEDAEMKRKQEAAAEEQANGEAALLAAQQQQSIEEDEIDADITAREVALFKSWLAEQKAAAQAAEEERKRQEEEDQVVGPVPMAAEYELNADYGTHLRPGEGDAMAKFVQSGERIPRRGEVGLTSSQISQYEQAGYVMSGSRHARMNAVRIRKENQVYTAEEKAALAMVNFEEKKRKEAQLLEDMKKLVDRTLGPSLPPVDEDGE